MKIVKIKISNYRSINNLILNIDKDNNFISFCGANNVGKTNVLNALVLFFNKVDYIPEKDCPYHKYYATRGGHYQPKIEIHFKDSKGDIIKIIKNWNLTQADIKKENKIFDISGIKNKKELFAKDLNNILDKINFFYLQSINISFPETIKYIMNSDIIDLETGKTRMSGRKKEMKEAIEKVLDELQSILDSLGENITPLLEKYKEGWGVAFDLPEEINTFRDLMIGKIDFYIRDKSNSKSIDAKGAGLQRLTHILMYFRILEKINEKKQSVILAIDEPDVYLHSGLQKKLLCDIKRFSKNNQIFITTHSPTFIDTVKLSNVFLLDQEVAPKKYKRATRKSGIKEFNAVSTKKVDLNNENGISILKNYLGIENTDYLLFDRYNILVEGEEDKIYLSKLMQHFNINIPNIIPVNGADNMSKYLEFYNSIAKKDDKNIFIVLLDNDNKGRDIYKKIKSEKFSNINVDKKFIISFFGFDPKIDKNGNNNANIETEDFLNPEILCYLTNKILDNNKLKKFNKKKIKEIVDNIQKPAHKNSGILFMLENEKNKLNPDDGQKMQINGEGVKSGIAKVFLNLDKEIIKLIGNKDNNKNDNSYKFLKEISKFKLNNN